MKLVDYVRRYIFSCCSTSAAKAKTTTYSHSTAITAAAKTRRSTSLADTLLFKDRRHREPQEGKEREEESLIDSVVQFPPSASRSTVVGTIYGHRRGRVSFCVQQDPSDPPSFLLDISIPTYLLAREMQGGLLRIALECDRRDPDTSASRSLHAPPVWKAYCNGRKVGYAVRRRTTDKDRLILQTVRSTSAGAGVLFPGEARSGGIKEEGEVMYLRASYERVVGSRDSVSYHLINPGGSSPGQELSVFLLRTG